jgi:hypothetical protein
MEISEQAVPRLPNWAPVTDFVLHKYYPGQYRIGTTCIYLLRYDAEWKIAISFDSATSGTSTDVAKWQHAWCQQHGLLHLQWPTRRELLRDIVQCHGVQPLCMPVPPESVRLRRITAGTHQVVHTDIYLHRHQYGKRICWMMGRTNCRRQKLFPRLSAISPEAVRRYQQCSCIGCQDKDCRALTTDKC